MKVQLICSACSATECGPPSSVWVTAEVCGMNVAITCVHAETQLVQPSAKGLSEATITTISEGLRDTNSCCACWTTFSAETGRVCKLRSGRRQA